MRLTNEEMARRAVRARELEDPDFDGKVTMEDLDIASPAAVTRLMNKGILHRDIGGPPPQRPRGAR